MNTIKQQVRRKTPYKWIFFSFTAFLIFSFFFLISPQLSSTSLKLNFSEKTISIDTTQLSIDSKQLEKKDPNQYFIDTSLGFIFKKPLSKGWTKPKIIHGFFELLNEKGAVFSPNTLAVLENNLKVQPYGPAFKEMISMRITKGSQKKIEFTGDTTIAFIESIIDKRGNMSDEDKRIFRKSSIGIDEINFSNEIMIQKFDKNLLETAPVKLSLPNFAVNILAGNSIYIDRLVADEKTVLAGGSLLVENAIVNGKTSQFRIDRLILITESSAAYYMVDIGFSPNTDNSLQVWEDLRESLNSFKVLED